MKATSDGKTAMTELHRANARRHAFRRAWQRYGLVIGEVELARIEARIAAGRAKLLRRDPDGCAVYRLSWGARTLYPVHDPALARVVTFLPKGWALRPPMR